VSSAPRAGGEMFIEEHLQELRRQRFTPPALARYSRELARHIRSEWDANPEAVRSVWSVALIFFAADFVAAAAVAIGLARRLGLGIFLAPAIGILPAFTAVSFSIGLLRNREGFRLSALNVPLVLTLLRLALLPAIVLFVLERRFALALAGFVLAALTDVADG